MRGASDSSEHEAQTHTAAIIHINIRKSTVSTDQVVSCDSLNLQCTCVQSDVS